MAHVLAARVAESSTSTGTGAITLAGALSGHRTFGSVLAASDTTEYAIVASDGSWEVGLGTYSSGTLTRTAVSASSNAGSAVNFGAGEKAVFLTPLATRLAAVPRGGTTGQALVKVDADDFDLQWADVVTPTGTQTLANKTLTSPTLNSPTLVDATLTGAIIEDIFTITDGTSVDINPANGSIQLWTLGASRTPTATNFAAGESMLLMVDDGASAFSITWTTIGVVWETDGGSAPTLATSGYTPIVLWKVGSTVYGARVGNA